MPRSSLSSSSSTVAQGRLRASLSEYGGAAIATEKKPLLIGHCALRAILCFNRGNCFDTAFFVSRDAQKRRREQRVKMIQFSNLILDRLIALDYSSLTVCSAPELPELPNYFGSFFLNNILRSDAADETKSAIIVFLRRLA